MTAPDPVTAQRIARLIRASRKNSSLTQQTVSTKLGISQGALSKMEHGLLIPSAPQWFDFCDLTQIPPEALKLGYVDRRAEARVLKSQESGSFRLPDRYLNDRGSKVRALLPLLKVIVSKFDEPKREELFRSLRVDPDFFLDMDNSINLNLFVDLAKRLIAHGAITREGLDPLIDAVLDPGTHGSLEAEYRASATPVAALRALIGNARFYECNFSYALDRVSKDALTIVVRPEPHLASFRYRDDDQLGDFMCSYKKAYFSNFGRIVGGKRAALEERECHFHGAPACVYDVGFAS